ncbi:MULTISPECIES: helix-turn-helix transcriptional regulator [Paenibacillus]|uniref:helix-turn-helix transcriptional regulator n=1 Tax=Paenibacillus TaxID=44249 RepID=UPI00041324F4|nr:MULTISPECIES: helix-turn-helix domain-containing protein [Paenibacillus]MCJ1222246.1 helix-turn-helix domain-containing protein [Paenibacillus polymyxa]
MLVDVKELQKRYMISRPTVYELVKEGMPHIRISERILRFDPDEVRRWFEERQSKAV